MKSALICLVGAAGFLLASVATAGNELGNGGDVVYCEEEPRVRMLDHYYATADLGVTVDLGDSALDPLAKVASALGRLERLDPYRAQLYRTRAARFFENARVLTVDLVDVPDSNHIFLPHGCRVRQVAIQRAPVFPHERLYTIDATLYNAMDADNQAALILHEIVYGEALATGHTNSIKTRYLTAHLLSHEIGAMSVDDYRAIMELVGFPYRAPSNNLSCEGARVPNDYRDLATAMEALPGGVICLAAGAHPAVSFQSFSKTFRIVGEPSGSTTLAGARFGHGCYECFMSGNLTFERLSFTGGVQVRSLGAKTTFDRVRFHGSRSADCLTVAHSSLYSALVVTSSIFESCGSGVSLISSGYYDSGEAKLVNNLFHDNAVGIAARGEQGHPAMDLAYANNLFVGNDSALQADEPSSYHLETATSGHNAFEFNGVNFAEHARPMPNDLFDDLGLDLDQSPIRPLRDSRLIGAGRVEGAPQFDFFGRARGDRPDIGAVHVGR